MPVDPTSDADFMKAPPHEQMAYLHDTDPEFAKASPQDQLGYLMHIRGLDSTIAGPAKPQMPDMQSVDMLGKPQTPESATAALPGYSGRPVTEKDLIPGAVVGGAAAAAMGGPMAAPYAWTAIKSAAAAVPTLVAMEGINYARKNLPGGQYIPAGAEWLPALMHGGKGKVATAEEAAAEVSRMEPRTKTMRPEGAPVETAVPENATQNVPLPNVTPTKASLIDPYRQQTLPAMTKGISGNVEAHAYDPATQTMVTHFKSGDIYKYEGVPPKVYDQFVNDSSQGSFHYNNIRGRYTTTKIGKVAPTKTAGQQVKSALSK